MLRTMMIIIIMGTMDALQNSVDLTQGWRGYTIVLTRRCVDIVAQSLFMALVKVCASVAPTDSICYCFYYFIVLC